MSKSVKLIRVALGNNFGLNPLVGGVGGGGGPITAQDLPGYDAAAPGQVLKRAAEGVEWGLVDVPDDEPRLAALEAKADAPKRLSTTPPGLITKFDTGSGDGSTYGNRSTGVLTTVSTDMQVQELEFYYTASLSDYNTTGAYTSFITVYELDSSDRLTTKIGELELSPRLNYKEGWQRFVFPQAMNLSAGKRYAFLSRSGRSDQNSIKQPRYTLPTAPTGFSRFVAATYFDQLTGVPDQVFAGQAPMMRLYGPSLPKQVSGPLDAADIPGFTAAAVGQFLTKGAQGELTWGGTSSAEGQTIPHLSALPPGVTPFNPKEGLNIQNFSDRMFASYTPTADITIAGLQYNGHVSAGQNIRARVYRVSDQALLRSSAELSTVAGQALKLPFESAITLLAGVDYRIGLETPSGTIRASQTPTAITGFNLDYRGYYGGVLGGFPNNAIADYWPIYDFLDASGTAKGVVGPLDMTDIPGFAEAQTGQFLKKSASGTAEWGFAGTSGGGQVALSTITSGGLNVTQRETGTQGFRSVGPVISASGTPQTYAEIRVPIRNATGVSGLTLSVAQVVLGNGNIVVKSVTIPAVENMTEAVFAGPFTIPAGEQHAFLVGADQGGWGDRVDMFFGNTAGGGGYPAPNDTINTAFTDAPTNVAAGQVLSGVSLPTRDRYRVVNLIAGGALAKGVVGTLDPIDFPVVASVAELPNGGTARLSGSVPAKIYHRASNGQLYEFAGVAVSG